jgi:HlyD family secretion protein
MKIVLKILSVLFAVFLLVGTLGFLYSKSRKKPVVVKTAIPLITNIVDKAVATGTIVPRKEIEIKPQVSGVVEKILVQAGDRIKNGDAIAKIKIIPDMVSLNQAESRVNQARIKLQDAQRSYERNKSLLVEKIMPESEFQKYELAYNTSQEEVAAAENNLELIKEGIAKNLGGHTNTLIRSTIDGMVLDIPVEEGNFVIETNTFNAGTTIATVADMGEMIFKGQLEETEVGKARLGMDVILTIGAIENEKFDAKLEYISPKGVEEKGTVQFEIKANVKLNPKRFLRAGYSANADIVLNKKDHVLALNEGLLQFEGDSPFVEVETGPQQFEKRFVKVGLSDGINIEIISGLSKTDKVKVP